MKNYAGVQDEQKSDKERIENALARILKSTLYIIV
jgi:hypothetical protein